MFDFFSLETLILLAFKEINFILDGFTLTKYNFFVYNKTFCKYYSTISSLKDFSFVASFFYSHVETHMGVFLYIFNTNKKSLLHGRLN